MRLLIHRHVRTRARTFSYFHICPLSLSPLLYLTLFLFLSCYLFIYLSVYWFIRSSIYIYLPVYLIIPYLRTD